MNESDKWRMLAWAVVALLVAWAAVRMLRAPEPASSPVRVERGDARAGGGEAGGLYVHVAGAVRRPGLLRLASGARVAVAIARAGGPTRRADLTGVNLAQPLEDRQQVIVPARGAAAPAAAAGSGATAGAAADAGASAPSLATATLEQLDGLDGIGPTLAKRISTTARPTAAFARSRSCARWMGSARRFATLRKLLRP